MEALYLLLSIVSTFFISSALSILLLLRTLLTRLHFIYSTPPPSAGSAAHSHSIYEGTVWHERRHPVRHSFRYSVRYALFDLDNSSKSPPGHLSADEARQKTETTGPVFLLTIPPSVGYDQNPLSVYYCYDLEGSIQHLKKCIAEVTNTPWGERVIFVFDPNSDLVAKPLHVSPFMDMLGDWRIRANSPGDGLSVSISVQHPELGDYFVATLKAKRISLFLGSDHDLFFWLMPHKVAFWIYWHALKLWWKNVPYIQHPRYSSPKYREEAMARDQKLQCSQAPVRDKDKYLPHDGFCPGNFSDGNYIERQFKWRDAKWPWG
ncbi:hypothetical protein P3X46_032978 [Hevea brasiliensis]|uniref:DUF1995 domain-containing protein n=1 Tax=Hevea brasiliensis TaxID=3981 RepID=A0ABQ9KF09_HEVBR|nr:uncharacterized protein LOC110641801 [Hevea brasiliensis]KAJ9135850.1 hypothetical protein P3X46_032978 [Hevea brasiliensis]